MLQYKVDFDLATMPSVGLSMAPGTICTQLPGCAFVFLLEQHTYTKLILQPKESWCERNNGD